MAKFVSPIAISFALAVVTLAGCASQAPKKAAAAQPAPKAAASGSSAFPAVYEDWAKVGYRLDWSGYPFPTAPGTKILTATAFADVFVIQNKSSEVATLDIGTGERRWAATLANPLTKFVGITRDPFDASRIIVSSESEAYVLAAPTGTLLAREQYSRVVDTRPLMEGNLAVFGTSTGEVLAHLMGRNVKAWGFQSTGAINSNLVKFTDGNIGAVSQSGDVMFLTPRGQMIGRARILAGLATDPVTDGNLLFVAGMDQSVWCFAPSGTQVWRYRTSHPLRTQPTVQNGILYVAVPGQGLTALEAASGKVLWTAEGQMGTMICTRKGRAIVWDEQAKTISSVDPENGGVIERISVPHVVRVFTDGAENPNLYAVNEESVVGKFIPRD